MRMTIGHSSKVCYDFLRVILRALVLGVDFHDILRRLMVVLNPMKYSGGELVEEGEMAGPIIFSLLLGVLLLLVCVAVS